MKNIIISLDDDVYRQASIKAAEHDTSVSALVKSYLLQILNGTHVSGQSEFARLASQEQSARERLFAAGKGLRTADNLPREALHDRRALP